MRTCESGRSRHHRSRRAAPRSASPSSALHLAEVAEGTPRRSREPRAGSGPGPPAITEDVTELTSQQGHAVLLQVVVPDIASWRPMLPTTHPEPHRTAHRFGPARAHRHGRELRAGRPPWRSGSPPATRSTVGSASLFPKAGHRDVDAPRAPRPDSPAAFVVEPAAPRWRRTPSAIATAALAVDVPTRSTSSAGTSRSATLRSAAYAMMPPRRTTDAPGVSATAAAHETRRQRLGAGQRLPASARRVTMQAESAHVSPDGRPDARPGEDTCARSCPGAAPP